MINTSTSSLSESQCGWSFISLPGCGCNTSNSAWHTEATQAGWITYDLTHPSTQYKAHSSRCKANEEEGGSSWLCPHLSAGEGKAPSLTSSRSGMVTHFSDDPEQESSLPEPQCPHMYIERVDYTHSQAPSTPELMGATPLEATDPHTQSPPSGSRKSCTQSAINFTTNITNRVHRPGLTHQSERFSCPLDTTQNHLRRESLQ